MSSAPNPGPLSEELQRLELLNRFFVLSLDMISIVGFDGTRRMVNPAWERILGYTEEAVKNVPLFSLIHPEDRAAASAIFESARQGGSALSFEARYRHRDGSYRWLLWNVVPFVEEQLIYAGARDITDRKLAEEHIQTLRQEAESANRAKTEFLAGMSHEIRTPLNVVLGMGDLLERTGLDAQQREYVRVLQQSGSTLLALVNDVLDLSKVESGRLVLEEIPFDLPELLDAVTGIMSVRARQKGIDLHCEIAPGTPAALRGDPDRLRQVLINLVGNAVKFTEHGSVAVRVQSDPENPQSGALLFSVSDTGIGIPKEKLELIFEPFTQGDASTTRTYGGTGLGLAISRRLVELMRGRIWAESHNGATFYFTAQFSPAPPAPASAGESAERIQAPSALKILVADDSEENRFLMAEYLRHYGYHLDFAENGSIAVGKFCAGNYDLVLMDLRMPQMDGYTATREIRSWERQQGRPAVPILALTASAMSNELQNALDAGCTAYLRKPVRLRTLLETVAKYAPAPESPEPDERLRASIPGYLGRRREDARSILAALDRGDFESIRDLGHKMQGTGASFGFPRITEIGAAIETAARAQDAVAIRAHADELSAIAGT